MRHARARRRRGREVAHGVGRGGLAVIGDDRRALIVVAKVETGAAILLHIEVVGGLSDRGAHALALGAVSFDLRRDRFASLAHGLRVVHGKMRHLLGDWQPLGLIGIENGGVGPATQMGGEQPGQVGGIRDAGIHAVAGKRHPEMAGVAADEDPSLAKLVGDQAAPDPVFLADQLVREISIDAEQRPDAGIAIDPFEFGFVVLHVGMHQPHLAAVDGIDVAHAARIHRE